MSEQRPAENGDTQFIHIGPKKIEYPDHWRVTTIDSINSDDNPICYGVLKPGPDINDGIPLIKIEDLEGNKLAPVDSVHRISEDLHGEFSRSEISGGEVLISVQGTIGRVAIVPDGFPEANISRTVARITPNDQANPVWLKNYLLSNEARVFMKIVSSGSTRSSLNIGTLRSMKALLPPLAEQRRIADILSTVDEQIRQTEEIIEATEELRIGLRQEFFHEGYFDHETEERGTFGQMPVGWEVKSLDEVADVTMGSSPKSEYYNDSGDGLPFFQANNEFGYRNPEHDRWCSEPKKIAEEGDTLVTIRGTYVGQVNEATDRCCIGRGLAAVSAVDVDQEYLFHQLAHREPYVKSIASGSTFDSINSTELNSLSIQLPDLKEQKKIADILKELQVKYLQETEYKQHLQELKRGLMQDLLTGKKRVSKPQTENIDN